MSTLVAHAHLHALRAAGVGADPLAAAVGLGDGGGGLLVGEVGVLGALGAGDLLAGHRQLDLVHAEVDELAHGLAHALGAVGELGDRLDQRAAGDGDLGAVGQVAGAGDASGVDGVAADHVEPVLGRGGAQAHGVAGVDVGAGGLEAEQQVLLDRHGAQAVEVGGVVPGEVGVRVAQPGHQGAAAALDHPGAFGVGRGRRCRRRRCGRSRPGRHRGRGRRRWSRGSTRCGTGSWWSGRACRAFLCAEATGNGCVQRNFWSRSVTRPAASSAVQCPTPGRISTVAWPWASGDCLAGLGRADLVVGAGDQQQRQRRGRPGPGRWRRRALRSCGRSPPGPGA